MTKYRQAVVVIHGMGTQRPMETLGGFVDAVLEKRNGDAQPHYWNKPDLISQLLEVRRLRSRDFEREAALTLKKNIEDSGETPESVLKKINTKTLSTDLLKRLDKTVKTAEALKKKIEKLDSEIDKEYFETDFYEYYWQHHMEGTTIVNIFTWIGRIFNTRFFEKLGWALILLAVIVALFVALLGASWLVDTRVEGNNWIRLVMAGIFFWIAYVVNDVLIKYIGDVARYLDPDPANIIRRQAIRADGVQLIKNLHDVNKYERIILVGHSLGSIIAYDILRYSWVMYHDKIDTVLPNAYQEFLDAIETLQNESMDLPTENKDAKSELDGKERESEEKRMKRIRKAQVQLFMAQRKCGNPWLISDFITLGSPLVYGDIFFHSSQASFDNRKEARELITCLPLKEGETFAEQTTEHNETILHHAALFACTRWTNLFFRSDKIGGPLQRVFGRGIDDKPYGAKSWSPLPRLHTAYWSREESIKGLRNAIDFNIDNWLDIFVEIKDACKKREEKLEDERKEAAQDVAQGAAAPTVPATSLTMPAELTDDSYFKINVQRSKGQFTQRS
jgi:hypothetical protein